MNRKGLLIAVVAVAAIGIVAGAVLAGAGQSGSLAGTIAPGPPVLTAKYHGGLLVTTVWGTFKTAGGDPLPGQPLTIERYERSADEWQVWDQTTTGADGTYKVKLGGATARAPRVEYPGGSYNGISYSPMSVTCTLSAGVPL